MIEVSRQQLVVYAAALVAIALIGARYEGERRSRAGPPRVKVEQEGGAAGSEGGKAFVHVTGAVPGRASTRCRRGRGSTWRSGGRRRHRRADLQGVNLAAKGLRRPAGDRPGAGRVPQGSRGQGGPGQHRSRVRSDRPRPRSSSSTAEGIGPATAQKILDWRKEHGGFGSVEDLRQVSGIGPKRFDSLKEKVRM